MKRSAPLRAFMSLRPPVQALVSAVFGGSSGIRVGDWAGGVVMRSQSHVEWRACLRSWLCQAIARPPRLSEL